VTTLTADQGLILPAPSDPDNVPTSFTQYNAGVESRLVKRYLSAADRTARNPTPTEGELSYLLSTGSLEIYDGTAWSPLFLKLPVGVAASTSSQTGFTTTEVVSLTVSSMVFKAGLAYRAHLRAAVYGTAGAQVLFRLRKTNAAGANWGEYGRIRCEGTSAADGAMANGSIILLRSAGSDLTVDVALTVVTDTGTGNVFADAASPRSLTIEPIGLASTYTGLGVDVS
jgi:hypothetical protein